MTVSKIEKIVKQIRRDRIPMNKPFQTESKHPCMNE